GIAFGRRAALRRRAANASSSSRTWTSRSSESGRPRRAASHKRSPADSDLSQSPGRPAVSVDAVEKERTILERLERIDGLRRNDAPAEILLDEVRALLSDAEDWVREEHVPSRTADAVERAAEALAAGEGVLAFPRA